MGISFAQLRNLDTSKLTTAADTAVAVGKDMESRAGDIVDAAKNGNGSDFWNGADADAQNALLNTFPAPLNAAGSIFKSSAGTIDTLVTELEAAKSDIETAISSYPRLIVGNDGSVTYPPTNSAEDAQQMQAQAQDLAAKLRAAVDRANTADTTASSQLAANDTGAGKPVQVRLPDGSYYLTTGDGNNKVKVTNDADGNLVVTVDDKEFKYDKGTNLTLNSGKGDDEIDVDKSVDNNLTLATGDGKDTITDHDSKGNRTFVTGEGDDTVATTGDNRNIYTEGGNDSVKAIGDKNNLAGGGGDDNIETTGGKVFGGDGNDTIKAGDHDNPFYRDKPEHSTDIYGGAGDDKITGSDQNETIVGGGGDDEISGRGGTDIISGNKGNDEIYGNAGNDNIAGGDGRDYIDGQDGDDHITGGADNDTIYGLDGRDIMSGDGGDDYLEGGTGNDDINGGDGKDVVSGGRDNDFLEGGKGDDTIYAGHGKDLIDAGEGTDKAFVQDEDYVDPDKDDKVQKVEVKDTSFIDVEGSEEFKDRIRADLDMYGASPTGHHMIDALRNQVSESSNDWLPGEDDITISEYDKDNGSAYPYPWIVGDASVPSPDEIFNDNPHIKVNPEFHLDMPNDGDGRPSTILYHELSHAYDRMNDGVDHTPYSDADQPDSMYNDDGDLEGVPNGERAAAGLPIDHDNNPATDPIQDPNQPYQVTENGLREEMGLPLRPTYGIPTQPN
ncbi:M91 family zinc metallopeptidase [Stackebrandtia nassauensis]|uniref:Hemolysin-type calcium-binding region n=1 Tax=Stackebrandtia nassauensis (strain DSM 44728 / CIP 108903 / NRRL B-16338 / NBRC 102104 / LLR-40K-21) TaxID=446470 RepID=D3Q7Q3_STANL|nr:M91 family zinc metallopeptidase [Stackebrandtia nassauensis]ADD44395.1 Hemolysin-type calcium-binding region [Stackebrandtia nassauensis DSM 44728]